MTTSSAATPVCLAIPKHDPAEVHDGLCTLCYPNHRPGSNPAVALRGVRPTYCSSCGQSAKPGGSYCDYCGHSLADAATGPPSWGNQAGYPYPYQAAHRPGQIVAAAVLMFVLGGLNLLGSLFLIGLGDLDGAFAVIGVVLLLIGAFEIWIGVALLRLQSWARVAGIVVGAIGGVLALISLLGGTGLSLIGLGLDIAVVILLASAAARDAL